MQHRSEWSQAKKHLASSIINKLLLLLSGQTGSPQGAQQDNSNR